MILYAIKYTPKRRAKWSTARIEVTETHQEAVLKWKAIREEFPEAKCEVWQWIMPRPSIDLVRHLAENGGEWTGTRASVEMQPL